MWQPSFGPNGHFVGVRHTLKVGEHSKQGHTTNGGPMPSRRAPVHAWSLAGQSWTQGNVVHMTKALPCLPGHTADAGPTWLASAHLSPLFYRLWAENTWQRHCPVTWGRTHDRDSLPWETIPCLLYRVPRHLCYVFCPHGRELVFGSE
jgi:hypothetical protein